MYATEDEVPVIEVVYELEWAALTVFDKGANNILSMNFIDGLPPFSFRIDRIDVGGRFTEFRKF